MKRDTDDFPNKPKLDRRRFFKTVTYSAATIGGYSQVVARSTAKNGDNQFEELIEDIEQAFDSIEAIGDTMNDGLLVDYRREKVDSLIEKTRSIDSDNGVLASLTSKLEASKRANNRAGKYAVQGEERLSNNLQDTTDNILRSYIKELKSLSREGKISEEQSGKLTQSAEKVIQAANNKLAVYDKISEPITISALYDRFEILTERIRSDVSEIENLEGEDYEASIEFRDGNFYLSINPVSLIPVAVTGFKTVLGIVGAKKVLALGGAGALTYAASKGNIAQIAAKQGTANLDALRRQLQNALLSGQARRITEEIIKRTAETLDKVLEETSTKDIITKVYQQLLEIVNPVWPEFQFDPGNTGFKLGASPTGEVEANWPAFSTNGTVNSPIAADGTVYFGSADGSAYAIDASTGGKEWEFTGNGDMKTPAIDPEENVVFIGDNSAKLYALDGENGDLLAQQDIGDGGGDVWAIKDNVVYTNGGDQPPQGDAIVAVDVSYTDSGVTLSEKWRVQTGECFGGGTAAAVADGVVYITEDCGRTWALNASNGDVQWKFDDGSGDGQGSPPTVAEGTVYFGTNTVDAEANTVYALDADSKAKEWDFTFTPGGDVTSSPAIANGVVYFGSDNGYVYAVDASDGTEVWDEPFSTSGSVSSSPAVMNGVVYIGSNDGNLYGIDTETGDEKFSYSTGNNVSTSPAISNGNIYIGAGSDVYSLSEK